MRPYILLPILALVNMGANAVLIHNYSIRSTRPLPHIQDAHNRRQVHNADFNSGTSAGPPAKGAFTNSGSPSGSSPTSGSGSLSSRTPTFDPASALASVLPGRPANAAKLLDRRVISVSVGSNPAAESVSVSRANGDPIFQDGETGSADTDAKKRDSDHAVVKMETRSHSSVEDEERRRGEIDVPTNVSPGGVTTRDPTITFPSGQDTSTTLSPRDNEDHDTSDGDTSDADTIVDDLAESSLENDPVARNDTADPIVSRDNIDLVSLISSYIDCLRLSGNNPSGIFSNAADLAKALQAHLNGVRLSHSESLTMAKRVIDAERPVDVPMPGSVNTSGGAKKSQRAVQSITQLLGLIPANCNLAAYQIIENILTTFSGTGMTTRNENADTLPALPSLPPPLSSLPPRLRRGNGSVSPAKRSSEARIRFNSASKDANTRRQIDVPVVSLPSLPRRDTSVGLSSNSDPGIAITSAENDNLNSGAPSADVSTIVRKENRL